MATLIIWVMPYIFYNKVLVIKPTSQKRLKLSKFKELTQRS